VALWGTNDSKTATGTIEVTQNADLVTGNVVGTGTSFTTEAREGDYIIAAGNNYVITEIIDNTNCIVKFGVNGANVVAQTAGASYDLSEKPAYVALTESASSVENSGNAEAVYGVDAAEAQAARAAGNPVAHAGWVRRVVGTGGRSGRTIYETLVAGGSTITGDAEDVVFPDVTLLFTTQPADASANSTADEQATFNVVTDSIPAGASPTFLWEYTTTPGDTGTFATTVAVGGFSGQTTDTLTVDANTIPDNTQVRVTISAAGADNAISDNATLTVTV